jgi:hypothetical protein
LLLRPSKDFARHSTNILNIRDGNDGPWSSFPIQVGTPAQSVRVFVSTAATSTWVIGDGGCEGSGIPTNCSNIRGSLFDYNASSTWTQNGEFGLFVEDTLGLSADGMFGFETVELGFPGSGGPTLSNAVTAWIITPDFFLGMLGMNPRPTNFSTMNDPQMSYLDLLYKRNIIPSLVYSYTAGAKYRFNSVLGSLTLGGYDDSLFISNTVSFPFYFDQTRDLTVAIQSITASNGTTKSLLPNGILALIDSTVPQIWLPLEACKVFETAFDLVYDESSELYLVNDTQHNRLKELNSNVTFTIATTLNSSSAEAVDITFPYSAFDLEVSYPIVANTSRYFPLRRAANDTQYVLGRTFLQEAYLTINYHHQNFSVSQRAWDLNKPGHLVSVLGPNGTNGTTEPQTSSSYALPKQAMIGLSVSLVILVILAIVAAYLYLKSRRRRRSLEAASAALAASIEAEDKSVPPDPFPPPPGLGELENSLKPTPELHDEYSGFRSEVDGTPFSEKRFELPSPGTDGRAELEAPYAELESPHGTGELSSARPVEIDPPPRFGNIVTISGEQVVKADSESDDGSEESEESVHTIPERRVPDRAPRPFSWQLPTTI